LHNNQGKHARNFILFSLLQKVFVGPHFWLTKHYLKRVTESGVLQKKSLIAQNNEI
jgi:hypothetical protein